MNECKWVSLNINECKWNHNEGLKHSLKIGTCDCPYMKVYELNDH